MEIQEIKEGMYIKGNNIGNVFQVTRILREPEGPSDYVYELKLISPYNSNRSGKANSKHIRTNFTDVTEIYTSPLYKALKGG